MRRVLLAGVALAALSFSPAVIAQQRSPADETPQKPAATERNQRTQQNQTQTQTQQERQQERQQKAQDNNRSSTQPGRETGQERAQQQSGHDVGQDRAQQQSGHEVGQDRAQQQRDQRGTAQSQDRNQSSQDRAQQQQQQRDQRGTAQSQDRNQPSTDRTQTQSQSGSRDQNQQQSRDTDSNRSGSSNVDVTGSIRVDQEKASRVHEELLSRGERSNVNISVSVGERIPDRVRLRPLPSRIISISPEFRGYNYVIIHDEIVIVEPRTHKVVTIIRGGGGPSMQRTTLRLEPPQRTRIRREIRMDGMRRFNIDVRPGMIVPQDVVLQPLPQMIVEEIPEVREYRFFVDRDDIVLVDPNSREVEEILR